MKKRMVIGSCGFRKEGWLNLDKSSSHYSSWQSEIDLDHDLMTTNPINLNDNTIEKAYSSHTIEHLSDFFVDHLFKEVYRICKKGATFRITCPDMDRFYKAYTEGDHGYINSWKQSHPDFCRLGLGQRFLYIFASYLSPFKPMPSSEAKIYSEVEVAKIFSEKTKSDALTFFTNECQLHAPSLQHLYPGEHISWWGYFRLKSLLEKNGFRNIIKCNLNESSVTEFAGFDYLHDDNTQKPHHTLAIECKK